MPEPHNDNDLPDTVPLDALPADPAARAALVRTSVILDLERARGLAEQSLADARLVEFREPLDLALYREMLTQTSSFLTRAAVLLADQTFKMGSSS